MKLPDRIYNARLITPDGEKEERFIVSDHLREMGEEEVIHRIRKCVQFRALITDCSEEYFDVVSVEYVEALDRAL
ncbi:hypothetical protein PXK30_09460 [Phaeobacter gallaeciensis]|uniref:hypothetical protein n=1 Tax=Phaeobacter gallaeciensis TaxID=60890 RepID=UPI00237EFCE1|nr:hypothetical protein [Phaeobacter gallaeciensis]MDE4303651.1 hypothetical protein [Phaeobacter gallaeciensis]MDE4307868.1 hypothetical protein [Phaeobacter gallaeciensis]MDE4312326.1 hypothetical protein [Phaeobacter gallaeciensis]MDE4316797.1 hypothetical protein [Phaeobacter gallaeciensis]MDE4321260.1 hypothetical protein [Phaeobacter gallaeciensis]